MRIKKLELKNFKRFTDLTIDNIPDSAKLVLLIGSNGSGKSSVFDAFELFNSLSRNNMAVGFEYYRKIKDQNIDIKMETFEGLTYHTDEKNSSGHIKPVSAFYGRTSFRQTPRLVRTQLGQGGKIDLPSDSDRPRAFIEKDERFENDVEKMTEVILKDFFRSDNSNEQIRNKYIKPINTALKNIFGEGNGTKLQLIEIIPPLEGKVAQINFLKGKSEIHYNFLSAGEKEVFNLLINLLTRGSLYTNTLYFMDELDIHLNTKLQYYLLKELTENWIPEKSQLWTATHSLGFIEYAKQSENAAIYDLDDFDFDEPKVLNSESKESLDIYEIAVPKELLFEMLKGKKIIVCENQNDEYYNLLSIADTIFVGVRDSKDVFLTIKRDSRAQSIRDRDFMSDSEIEKISQLYPNHHILKYYDFENYLYHPENIRELNPDIFNEEEYVSEILKQKNAKVHYILANIGTSRQNYEEFKTDNIKDKDLNSIVDDLTNNEFERFYKFFDMKSQFDKTYLSIFNLSKEKLVQTKWFKSKITEILNS